MPHQETVTSATALGRPMGAAFGRPFPRRGLVEHCSHVQCWEPEPLILGDSTLGARSSNADKGTLVPQLRPEPLHAMRKYRNQSVPADRWANIEPFVLDAVALVAPACAYLAERLMVAVTPYVDWVVHVNGMQKVANVFHPVLIRRYISRDDLNLKDKTLRDYRSFLLRISEVVLPEEGPIEFAPLNGQSVTAPYTDLEMNLLETWALGQSTALRRRGAGAVLALGAGAGLDPWEMQQLRRSDVRVDRDGALVDVQGGRLRSVPVLERWEQLLIDSLADVPDDAWVLGREDRKATYNFVTPFINHTDFGNEPKPVPTRMRATWITTQLAGGTHVGELMAAGGLRKPEHLVTSLRHIPTMDASEHRRRILAEAREVR